MFPVHKNDIVKVEYRNIESFRTFKDNLEKNNYIVILKKEMKQILNKDVAQRAENLYNRKYDYPDDRVSLRCLDFKDLEQKCIEYRILKDKN